MSEKYCLGCGVNLNLAEHEYCGFCKPRYVHTGETMANDLVLFKTVETSLRRQIKELRSDNKALMEALEGILESYDLVVDEERLSPGIKDMFKGFFQNEPEKARKAIAEAIQGEK